MSEYTKEPWGISKCSHGGGLIHRKREGDKNAQTSVQIYPLSDCERIVICVNSCSDIPNPEAIPDMVEWIKKMKDWLNKQAARSIEQSNSRFEILNEANQKDAKNFQKMADDANAALKKAGVIE